MNRPKLLYRLDLKLTFAVSIVFAIWFGSLLFALHLLQYERNTKEIEIQRNRLKASVEKFKADLLNGILLKHDEALRLTIEAMKNDSNLASVELRTLNNQLFTVGDPLTDKIGNSDFQIEQTYPISHDNRDFGQLKLVKRFHQNNQPDFVDSKLLAGALLMLLLVFLIIRRFVRREIVQPLSLLIEHFNDQRTAREPGPINTPRSYEIEKLGKMFQKMNTSIQELQRKDLEQERKVAVGHLAAQVAHDIRGPLTALHIVLDDVEKVPEKERILVRNALKRITDIANNLLTHHRNEKINAPKQPESKVSSEILVDLVEPILSEKRHQYRSQNGIVIDANYCQNIYGLCIKTNPQLFKRALSNLINNAVEACDGYGKVTLTISRSRESALIELSDTGMGIPAEIIPKLMVRGATHGKQDGNGLGLFQAKQIVEDGDGTITIRSELGIGTTVSLNIPIVAPPVWLPGTLTISPGTSIVVLDDDPSIHEFWDSRFSKFVADNNVQVLHFYSAQTLKPWFETSGKHLERVTFLVDYELGAEDLNGLQVVVDLNVSEKSIIVSSRANEDKVRESCMAVAAKLVPKTGAIHLPIAIT